MLTLSDNQAAPYQRSHRTVKALISCLLLSPMLSHAKILSSFKPSPSLTCTEAYQQQSYVLALAQCQQEANAGDPSAHTMLGLLYHRGLGCPKDDEEAYQHFQFAAQRGNAVAQFYMGKMLSMGTAIESDEAAAFRWFEKAANQQYAPAEFLVAICYRNGIGVTANLNQSEYWYRQAQSHGLSAKPAHPTIVNVEPPIDLPQKIHDQSPHAIYLMAKAYLSGDGVMQNDRIALHYFEQAARQNHPEAQGYLAWMMALGLGGDLDLAQAVYWFKTASTLPRDQQKTPRYDPKAISGRSVPRTPEKQYQLAKDTLETPLGPKDIEMGLGLMHMAAKQNHSGAQFYLSELYQQGRYVEQNLPLAFSYAENAAIAGDPKAQYALGWYYANGMATQRDLHQAALWFDKASRIGDHRANMALDFVDQQIALQQIQEAPVTTETPVKKAPKAKDPRPSQLAQLLQKATSLKDLIK